MAAPSQSVELRPSRRARGAVMAKLNAEALAALTRTWAAILHERHPELCRIHVSVVREDEWLGLPAISPTVGERDLFALPDNVKAPVEGSRAA